MITMNLLSPAGGVQHLKGLGVVDKLVLVLGEINLMVARAVP